MGYKRVELVQPDIRHLKRYRYQKKKEAGEQRMQCWNLLWCIPQNKNKNKKQNKPAENYNTIKFLPKFETQKNSF